MTECWCRQWRLSDQPAARSIFYLLERLSVAGSVTSRWPRNAAPGRPVANAVWKARLSRQAS